MAGADSRRTFAASTLANRPRREAANPVSPAQAQHARRGIPQSRGADVMAIFDQGYQHWSGKLSGHTWRWLPISRQGIRAALKKRWMRQVTFLAWVPALMLA